MALNPFRCRTITNPVTNKPIQYFEVVSKAFQQQIYPGLQATNLVGYDGIAPGPTFMIERGTETVVRFINASPQNNISIHLHGSPSRAPWDGWAEDMTPVGQYKDYYYPNSQSGRMLWYHDHAVDITAVNAYFGQAGTYILHDPAEDALGLPSGYGVYDIPLVLSSKQYQSNGQLFSPAGETVSLYGDVVHVNGQPWPFFNVGRLHTSTIYSLTRPQILHPYKNCRISLLTHTRAQKVPPAISQRSNLAVIHPLL